MKNSIKKNAITLAITLVAAGSIFGVVAYNGEQMTQAEEAQRVSSQQAKEARLLAPQVLPQIAVQMTQSGTYQAEVIGYGETKPRYELDFASEVSGQVKWVADEFESGGTVKKGAILAKLDDTSYQQALAQAQSDVATAKLELLEEQRQGEQARSEWQRSGMKGAPNSPLVLREPQLASATAKLNNANKALAKAKQDLNNTQIRAPFDAVIVGREIQPGSYVNVGTSVASLYSVDRIEIEIPLSEKQWANLPEQSEELVWAATVTDSTGQHQWQANVERRFQYVAKESRQRSIVLTIDHPLQLDDPLFPGTFVQANIIGSNIDNLWQLPASSLSQQGNIWTVDDQGRLEKIAANIAFEKGEHVYIEPVDSHRQSKVVMRPLSNFKVGMKVQPVTEDDTEIISASVADLTTSESNSITLDGEG